MSNILHGSCHCGAVEFAVESDTAAPYQRCYCSICRKTNGGGGYAINIMGWTKTLKISGEENISVYVSGGAGTDHPIERRFCSKCGSGLWVYCSRWPELMHPFASVIDTPLPIPDHTVHIMTTSKANWVRVKPDTRDEVFDQYPDCSIEDWHQKHQKQ